MKLLICPLNGPRNIDEFQYLGPLRETPDPDATSDADWARHLFRMPNGAGVLREWWRHRASNYVFLAERGLRDRHCDPHLESGGFGGLGGSRGRRVTRLDPPFGSRIDRTKPLAFTFEGRDFGGYAGDTIASALAASGQWVLSRSFKYHRRRGLFAIGGHEAAALVQVGPEPNVAADTTPLAEGMAVTAQNVSGSLARDRGAILDRFGQFLPVGFYYRTFMGPTRGAWFRFWEPLIRATAGLGRVDPAAVPRGFDKEYLHCDVLVVGGGPAGLSAAIAAARAGADVVLCDEGPKLGGTLTHAPGGDAAALIKEARGLATLRIMTETVCNGLFADNWLPLITCRTLRRCRARQVILAPGGVPQPAVFRGNDLPGIVAGESACRLMAHHGVRAGQRAVVLAGTPEGLDVAEMLSRAGTRVAAVVLPRPLSRHDARIEALRDAGTEVVAGQIDEARGGAHLRQVRIGHRWIDCDLLTVSVGHAPAWQLAAQAGAKVGYDEAVGRFSLTGGRPDVRLAGSVAGIVGAAAVLADGRRAGVEAAVALGLSADAGMPVADTEAEAASCVLPLEAHPKGRDFVDFDEDLQIKDLINATREGYRELELVKRFSTVGMGPSQRHRPLRDRHVEEAAGQHPDEHDGRSGQDQVEHQRRGDGIAGEDGVEGPEDEREAGVERGAGLLDLVGDVRRDRLRVATSDDAQVPLPVPLPQRLRDQLPPGCPVGAGVGEEGLPVDDAAEDDEAGRHGEPAHQPRTEARQHGPTPSVALRGDVLMGADLGELRPSGHGPCGRGGDERDLRRDRPSTGRSLDERHGR